MNEAAKARRAVRSLTMRLLGGMLLPMVALALLLGIGGAWAIEETVEAVNDRILSAASRAIADSLTVEDGEIALVLSPAIFGMLENNARDNVYYAVRYQGRVLTGYADLPSAAPRGLADTEVAFGKSIYRGRNIRIVAEARRLPQLRQPVIVEVAETLDVRNRATHQMMIGLALLEIVLIGVTAILLPLAVRWGLRPVRRVRDAMDRRSASDLTPVPLTDVPAELRELVSAFNAMLSRLDAAVAGMRRFTADASHQMRTPLSILRTHVALLRNADPGSVEAAQSIDDIDHASERLRHLLVQLLALARADSAMPEQVAREPVDLNRIAEQEAGEHAMAAVRAGIDLQFVRAAMPAPARTHPSLAAEMLSNLIDNAIRYNRAGGSVTVGVERQGREMLMVVEDDGPGIAPVDRERAFTRFTRLDPRDPAGGSGLGLPIAQSLAHAIGAHIRLETPASGKGLRVEIAFVEDAVV